MRSCQSTNGFAVIHYLNNGVSVRIHDVSFQATILRFVVESVGDVGDVRKRGSFLRRKEYEPKIEVFNTEFRVLYFHLAVRSRNVVSGVLGSGGCFLCRRIWCLRRSPIHVSEGSTGHLELGPPEGHGKAGYWIIIQRWPLSRHIFHVRHGPDLPIASYIR